MKTTSAVKRDCRCLRLLYFGKVVIECLFTGCLLLVLYLTKQRTVVSHRAPIMTITGMLSGQHPVRFSPC